MAAADGLRLAFPSPSSPTPADLLPVLSFLFSASSPAASTKEPRRQEPRTRTKAPSHRYSAPFLALRSFPSSSPLPHQLLPPSSPGGRSPGPGPRRQAPKPQVLCSHPRAAVCTLMNPLFALVCTLCLCYYILLLSTLLCLLIAMPLLCFLLCFVYNLVLYCYAHCSTICAL